MFSCVDGIQLQLCRFHRSHVRVEIHAQMAHAQTVLVQNGLAALQTRYNALTACVLAVMCFAPLLPMAVLGLPQFFVHMKRNVSL